MFICAITQKCSAPGEPMIRVVIETRPKTYTHPLRREDGSICGERQTHGSEIVKEISLSAEGFRIFNERLAKMEKESKAAADFLTGPTLGKKFASLSEERRVTRMMANRVPPKA